jgi:dipeptidyl aminopeptidase/acylaminoacyl peptidase
VNRVSAKVQTVVARAPLVDMNRSTGESIALLMGAWSEPNPEREEYRRRYEASPINHVTADDPPILFIHGDADSIVPIENSERTHDALQSVGVSSKLVVILGAAHGPEFLGALDPPDYLGEMVRWFDQHLKR